MTRVGGPWLDCEATQRVLATLEEAGATALLVGGCVRNALLDAPVADIDISTNMRPDSVMDLAQRAGLRAIPTGIDHGTVTVVADDIPHEVTTFRRDVATDGRRAVVAFADNVEEDAARRDFTMNALYATRHGDVVDPLGGMPDLLQRRVRFIGTATDRIREDHLRSLRFFRFHAWYGDPQAGLDVEGLAAIAVHLDGLETLSRERVGAEMLKLLAAPDPAAAVASMAQVGVLHRLLPGADNRALGPLVHLEEVRGLLADGLRRLAVLTDEAAADRLRLSKAQAARLHRLRRALSEQTPLDELAYRWGATEALESALLRAAVFEQGLAEGIEDDINRGASASFPLSAADLMPEFQGPALGQKLKDLERRWIASGFSLTRSDLLSQKS